MCPGIHVQMRPGRLRSWRPLHDVRKRRENFWRLGRRLWLYQRLARMIDFWRCGDDGLPRMKRVGALCRPRLVAFTGLSTRAGWDVRGQIAESSRPGNLQPLCGGRHFSRRPRTQPGVQGKQNDGQVPQRGESQSAPGYASTDPGAMKETTGRPSGRRRRSAQENKQALPERLSGRLPFHAQSHRAAGGAMPSFQARRHHNPLYPARRKRARHALAGVLQLTCTPLENLRLLSIHVAGGRKPSWRCPGPFAYSWQFSRFSSF